MGKVKSPAYSMYPRDILSSMRVSLMTLEEEGAYRRAIDFCWLNGSLPNDPQKLAIIIGKNCPIEVAKVVQQMFVIDKKNPQNLLNERLEIERKKQKENRKKKVKAGKASAVSRRKKSELQPENNGNTRSSSVGTEPSTKSNLSIASSSSPAGITTPSHKREGVVRAREDEKYPDWLVENEAVRMLWRQFHPEEAIPIGVQEKIAFEVTDLALWRDEVLDFWVENSHRPTSYGKMRARYRELVAKRERESSQPQARDPDHWRKHYAAELRKWLRHPMNDEQKQAVERALADLPKLSRDEWSERRGELEDLDILIV